MRIPRQLFFLVIACVSLVASACGSGSERATSTGDLSEAKGIVVVNSAGTITTSGRQRVMTAILGPESRPFLGGPNVAVTVNYEAVDGDASGVVDGAWLTTNASPLGLYVSYFDFPLVGQWRVVVSANGTEIATSEMTVVAESSVPNVGDWAPASDTPTGETSEEIAAISTDPAPDARLYELSIADAIANDRPTMIAFVTPAFCQTALCGPTLETVKDAAENRDDLDVVHVEPFDIELATAGELVPVPAMADWGLQTEPWVFVIDADGTVSASFEGIVGLEELEAALDL